MQLYNTLTKKIEDIAIEPNKTIRVYSCGPTVYAPAHIGNLRSFVFADTLVRTLRFMGADVRWVMNLTDIDDKTIAGAVARFGETATVQQLAEYTNEYTELFKKDLTAIGVDITGIEFVPISEKVSQMGAFILSLIEKGYAYETEQGDVYFNIEKYNTDFHDYGTLVGEKFLEGKKIGARVANDEYDKDSLSDFALWKAHDPVTEGNIYWEVAGLKKGRPGWHIECSVINHELFGGEPTDIHTGGVDLIFPHHTNEIAQAQPIYNPFVKTWCHSEHLLVDNKKMSKSANNFYTLSDIIAKGFDPLALRYLLLTTHYQNKVNFTWEALEAAQTALHNLRQKYQKFLKSDAESSVTPSDEKNNSAIPPQTGFSDALQNNVNTAEALAEVWEVVKSDIPASDVLSLLAMCETVLSIGIDHPLHAKTSLPQDIQKKIQTLIAQREALRGQKKFAEADALRTEIEELLKPFGATLKDTSTGSQIDF